MPSREVNDAVGEARTRTKEVSAADQLKAKQDELMKAEEQLARAETAMDTDQVIALRQRAAVIRGFISSLAVKAAEERHAQAKQAAEKRHLGIKRAIGSVIASIEDDEARIVEAAEAYHAAVERLNERYRQYELLVAEDAALRDRFGLESARLPRVVPPNERERVVEAVRKIERQNYASAYVRAPSVERCEFGLRTRRTYTEIAKTPGAEIIAQAGLKPFPPLTARQQEEAARVESERERAATPDPFLASEADAIAALPSGVSALTAGVGHG